MPEYDIRYRHGGDDTRIVRRAIAPPAATPELTRLELGEGESWVIGGGQECTVPPDEVIEKRGVAAHVPLIGALRLAPDGDLWVRRSDVGRDAAPIDIIDAAGHYRGFIHPTAPWPVVFGPDGRILALEEDDLGVRTVVPYRLVRF